MTFKKLVAPTLKDMFVETIQEMILSGELKKGEKLPPERTLAATMGISRAVVNSGIVELERKGFLEVIPRVGTFVVDYRRRGTLETLKAIMCYNRGRLRDEEIKSIIEIRDALDKLAVTCIIENARHDEINSLGEMVEEIKNSSTNEEAAKAAFKFQHEMAMKSRNVLLPLIFRSFFFSTVVLWERFCSLYGIEELYNISEKTLQKLKDRDVEGAIKWIENGTHELLEGRCKIYY